MSRNTLVKLKHPEITLSVPDFKWDIHGKDPKLTPERGCSKIAAWIKSGALVPCNENGKPLTATAAPDESNGESLQDLVDINIGSMNRAGLVDVIEKINALDDDADLTEENVNVPDLRESIKAWQEATVEART